MNIIQIYTGCLAQGAYYIQSEGEAAIIDPLREVEPYLLRAKQEGATIKYVFETHFHADFVSGHLDLATKTGATIVYGPTAKPKFNAHVAVDGEIFKLGKITIQLLHTPGHTMESSCFLVKDESEKNHALFSGDTLFLGDVGRPDLAQKAANLTQEQLASLLFDSLRTKILTLEDDVIIYPAHGAGSACGKNMMKETVDTLGHQRVVNYALRASMSREEFVKEVTDGLLPPPAYFPENVKMNKEGYASLDEVLDQGLRALSPTEFELVVNETNALILDTRPAQEFAKGFIPNSINIGIDGSFAPWVGALVPGVDQPILIVAEPSREKEIITRLARVGFDNSIGYLDGGYAAWSAKSKPYNHIPSISAQVLNLRLKKSEPSIVIDVRKPGEYSAEHVVDARSIPLDYLNDHLAEIPKTGDVYLYCAGGYRSMIAASILHARGWTNVIDVAGGFKAICESDIKRTAFKCASV